jgi:hypothetical protein
MDEKAYLTVAKKAFGPAVWSVVLMVCETEPSQVAWRAYFAAEKSAADWDIELVGGRAHPRAVCWVDLSAYERVDWSVGSLASWRAVLKAYRTVVAWDGFLVDATAVPSVGYVVS